MRTKSENELVLLSPVRVLFEQFKGVTFVCQDSEKLRFYPFFHIFFTFDMACQLHTKSSALLK